MGEAKRKQQSGQPAAARRGGPSRGLIVGLVALALVVAAVVWLSQMPADETALPQAPEDAGPFPAGYDRVGVSLGDADAPVVVREFADYQCPGCASWANVSQQIKAQFVESGDVRFVYFDFPLEDIHDNAMLAAQAARCAGDQGSYWGMHDRLFARQGEWSGHGNASAVFVRYGEELGLNPDRIRRCLDTELHREAVEESQALARRLGVRSTPTVMVDNIPMAGAHGWPEMKAVIERELAKSE